jgi:hypothetical protein
VPRLPIPIRTPMMATGTRSGGFSLLKCPKRTGDDVAECGGAGVRGPCHNHRSRAAAAERSQTGLLSASACSSRRSKTPDMSRPPLFTVVGVPGATPVPGVEVRPISTISSRGTYFRARNSRTSPVDAAGVLVAWCEGGQTGFVEAHAVVVVQGAPVSGRDH